jgi:HK97 family phage portal protein
MLAWLARPSLKADVSWSAYDPRWYRDIGGTYSDSGTVVVPESALSIAAVYRAVNVLAHSVASIPLVVYRRTDDGKERDREHPAYDLLHDKPNAFQTSFRWRHLLMTQAVLWGDHYSEVMPGVGGIGGLVPLNPDTTRVVDQMRDGRLVYVTRDKGVNGYGEERRLLQDEVFHIRGFSIDGKSGIPLTKLARNAMGLALSAERHGALFLKKGARFSGFLTTAASMTEPVRKANEDAWQRQYGANATGATPILTGGLEFKPVSANNRDSQWLEARTFQVEEILRFLGVPGVLCGYADKTATYASAEQFFLSFVTHSVRPWTENIAAELNGSVIVGSPDYFAEFVLEGLLKGDIKTRYDAYRIGIASGFLNRNEARATENMNPGPEELDTFLEPLNMVEAGAEREEAAAPARPAPAPAPREDDNEAAARSQFTAITERTAQRLARKELAAIVGTKGKLGAAAKYADKPDGWRAWLETFYADHAVHVSEDLGVPLAIAERYCAGQRERFAVLPAETESAESESIAALLRLTPARIAA